MIDTENNSKSLSRWRSYGWFSVIIVAAAVTTILYLGQRRMPTQHATGFALQGQNKLSPAGKSRLRVATFNIHGGKGEDGVRDLSRTASSLKGFDIIGLQEVHGAQLFGDRNQAKALGEALDMGWLFAATERRWWRNSFGNGLLSKLPVTKWERIPLAGPTRRSHRNVVVAVIPISGNELRVLVTHLDTRQYRDVQLKAVIEIFLAVDPPVVLMGDLNFRRTDEQIRRLIAIPGVVEPSGEGLGKGVPARKDWIFVRGLQATGSGTIDLGASDHPCIWAEFKIPDSVN